MCRYLEKVVPSPYGPRLPWHFPFSRSFWLSGDVTQGLGLMPVLKGLLSKLPWRKSDAQAYQQVQGLPVLGYYPCYCSGPTAWDWPFSCSQPYHVMESLHSQDASRWQLGS